MPAGRTNLHERYELIEVLGHGGMGVVYRAHDRLMHREVALKTLLDIDDLLTLEQFYQECGILAAMSHPNIISIYDVGEVEENGIKKPFLAMPLLPGATLDKLLRNSTPRFTVETLIEVIAQACRGLQAAHEMGLVHRDMKPSNIFVMDDDLVKVIDFSVGRSSSMGSQTSPKGTLAYMAPEQLQHKPATALSDQYALAAIAYEALTGRRPFQGATEAELAEAILQQAPTPVSDLNPNLGYPVSAVIQKGMARQPWQRFPNLREFGESLSQAVRGNPPELDKDKIKPRLARAAAAFAQGDFEFASELVSALENEGYRDREITQLRQRLEQAVGQRRMHQLLDSANKYVQAQEYPLALRKIQEALTIDPEHPYALLLQSQVEKERRDKEAGEWLQLARNHISNQAFPQAREALEQVIRIKPNEKEVLRLSAEIARREQDTGKTREKQAALYETAVQAWERGDLSTALNQLDALRALDRDSVEKGSGAHQSFYQQVRSESDALQKAYEEARRRLEAEDFDRAAAICKQYLNRYPGHALFQALRLDVEERQRQKLSPLVLEADRRADREPDLDRRVEILQEAASSHPEDDRLQDSLRRMKDRRDQIGALVDKARYYEERGQFSEALDQWQIVRSIHPGYPGLTAEVDRVIRHRDAQTHQSTRQRAIELIGHCIETGDNDRGMQAVAEALLEFPGDAELRELEQRVRQRRERTSQVQEILDRAREHSDANRSWEALLLLRQAYQLDSGNPVVRSVLLQTLIENARRLISQNPGAAEPMLREAIEIDPNHAEAQSLLRQFPEDKRGKFVSWCVSQARRMQAQGDVQGAMALLRNGLETYPRDETLEQLLATLGAPASAAPPPPPPLEPVTDFALAPTRLEYDIPPPPPPPPPPGAPAIGPAVEPARSGFLDETGPITLATLRPVSPPPPLDPLLDPAAPTRLEPVAAPLAPPSEAPLLDSPTGMFRSLQASPTPALPPPQNYPRPEATTAPPMPASGDQSKSEIAAPPARPPEPPPAAVPVRPKPAKPPIATPVPPADPRAKGVWKMALGALGLLLLLTLGALFIRHRGKTEPQTLSSTKVTLQASQPGATILVDGKPCGSGACTVTVGPGEHRAEARLDGYMPASASFQIQAGAAGPPPVQLALTPALPAVSISTNLNQATVTVDQGAQQPLQNGEIRLADLPAGPHSIQLRGEGAQSTFSITIAPAAAPRVEIPPQQPNLGMTIASALGPAAKVFTTLQNAEASLDGTSAGKIDPAGVDLTNLAPGAHELVVTAKGSSHRLVFASGPAPAMAVFFGAERNQGVLRITTGEDDVTVYVNGLKTRRSTQNGRLLLYLEPKTYKVRVEKDGFQATVEQSVEIKRGEEARADFQMVRTPQVGSVLLEKAPPDAEVTLDGAPAGATHPDGTLSLGDVQPGNHTLTVKKDSYRPLTRQVAVVAGQRVEVDGTLHLLPGTVKITLAPADVPATLAWKRDGEENSQTFTDNPLTLPDGSYTIVGRAPEYEDARTTVKVVAGRSAAVVLNFRKIVVKKAEPVKQGVSLADLEKAGGWTRDEGNLTRTGGNNVLLPTAPAAGTYTFRAMMQKGKRLEWIVNFVDAKNYVAYELNDDRLERVEYIDGKKQNTAKDRLRVKLDQWVQVTIEVTDTSIVNSIQQGANNYPAVDKLAHEGPSLNPGQSFVRGRFGFRVPGKDRLAVSAFTFTAR